MYIPVWLLVIAGVVLLTIFVRADAVMGLLRSLGCLIVGIGGLLLFGLAIYFLVQQNYVAALLAGSPFIAWLTWDFLKEQAMVWLPSGSLNDGRLEWLLKRHRRKVARLENEPSRVAEERIAFADRIALGPTLWKLYEEIKYFPHWYRLEHRGDWPGCKAIAADDISLVNAAQVSDLGVADLACESGAEHILWWLHRKGTGDTFVLILLDVDFDSGDPEDCDDSQFLSGRRIHEVFVVEVPNTVLLKGRLRYRAGIDWNAYSSFTVQEFRPREWVLDLYRTAAAVVSEQNAWGKEVVKKASVTAPDRARKNFMDG